MTVDIMDKKVMIAIVAVVVVVVVVAAAVFVMNNNSSSKDKELTIYVEDGEEGFHTIISAKAETKLDAAKKAFADANIDYTVSDEGWVTTIDNKGTVKNDDGTYTYWILFQWETSIQKWVQSATTITGITDDYDTVCYFYGVVDAVYYQSIAMPSYSPAGVNYDDTLLVFGNANEDNTIDSKEKEIISSLIGKDFSRYPMADANNDGKIDDADVTLVDKIIKREKTTVLVQNQVDAADVADMGDLPLSTVSIEYPLKNVVVINADLVANIMELDAHDVLVGYGATLKGLEKTYLSDVTNVKAARIIDETAYRNIKNIDSSVEGGIGALIIYNVNAVASKGFADDLYDAGIPMLILKGSMPDYTASAIVTLGFLLGGDYEEKGVDIAEFIQDEYSYISKTLGNTELPTSTSMSMGTSVGERFSQYTKTSRIAGSVPVYLNDGTSSKKIDSPEALMKLNPDRLNSFTTLGLTKLSDETIVSTYECDNFNYITPCNAYKNGYLTYINAALPSHIRVAYAAEALHPDLFEGYGDELFQAFVDEFMSYLDDLCDDGDFSVVDDCTCMITHDDYVAAGGTQ